MAKRLLQIQLASGIYLGFKLLATLARLVVGIAREFTICHGGLDECDALRHFFAIARMPMARFVFFFTLFDNFDVAPGDNIFAICLVSGLVGGNEGFPNLDFSRQ